MLLRPEEAPFSICLYQSLIGFADGLAELVGE
jgi:hypothetical protein